MTFRRFAALGGGILLGLLGASGTASPGAGIGWENAVAARAAAAPDSCKIITSSEAAAALGEKVTSPVRGRAFVEGGVACVFYGPRAPKGADPDTPVTDSVRVVLVGGPKARYYFDDYRSKVHAQSIPGLGDAAYYDGLGSLSVLRGDKYLRIAVIGVRGALAAEKALALDGLHRLPRARRITLQVGDAFAVSGTDLACRTQVGKNVIKGQKLVVCFKVKDGALAPKSYVGALGANGQVVVAPVTGRGGIGVPVFDRTAAAFGESAKQITAHAGDVLLLAGTDLGCSINNDAAGVYPACLRGTPTGGRPGSYGVAETEQFVAVVRFDSTGEKTKPVFKRLHGH